MNNDQKEIAVSLLKSGLSNIPVIGQLLTEVLLEYNGRIKQERLNKFIEIFKESVEDSNLNISTENLKSENFGDLLENVLKKSMYAKSGEKLIGFKNILFRGMKDYNQIERCDIFADLLSQVSNKHIEILKIHRDIFNQKNKSVSYTRKRELDSELYKIQQLIKDEDFIDYPENMNPIPELEAEETNIKNELSDIEESLKDSSKFRHPGYYQLSKGDYLFYLQDLSSKALLVDEGIGGIGTEAFEIMTITDLGLNFLEFITNS